ncbi:TonB-linked outer membrane protein, SusC/RagA family [Cruoricaptor ignavus]|uniref:TonB-linked outer membrane protein, SusC/RagA family n=1 Tax=Cruoricaptor ignavus TaxID=1118202 RepID=A0A1M6G5K5_9FLAO|nr:TonB-linked outer membrane protein, SusC/RagA family [Cruoricaptor ignavus]
MLSKFKQVKKSVQKIIVLAAAGLLSCELAAQTAQNPPVQDTLRERQIKEVVVTALGIKREQKALGYSAEKLNEEVFETAQFNNFATAMEGKVAGLKVLTPNAGPLETARIKLRGETSMVNADNAALIVIDGIPIDQQIVGTGAPAYGSTTEVPIDYGNILNSINAEDIESVTVLKGASASALYGERGANGAIMITTKSGRGKSGKLNIGYIANTSFETVLKWPDWQYEYGQGGSSSLTYYSYGASPDGVSTGATSSAFGPKFEGQYYFQYDPNVEGQGAERTLWRPYKRNVKDFFQTGTNYSNTLTLDAGWQRMNFRSSLNYTKNEWIMPNTGFERFTTNNTFNVNITDKFKAAFKVIYSNTNSDNLPATGYNNHSINYFMIFQNPNIDLAWYRPIWKKDKYQQEQIHPFSSYIDNPYLIAYEMTNAMNKNNVLGGVTLNYAITPNLDLMLRTGAEFTRDNRWERRPWNSAKFGKGQFTETKIDTRDLNHDLLATYKNDFGRFDMRASIGGSLRDFRRRTKRNVAKGLVEPGIYTLENGVSVDRRYLPYDKKTNSVYGMVNVGFDDKVYIDFTGRNDWTSTLPEKNWSFFYPSVSASVLLNNIFELGTKINLFKLRGSWAKTGFGTSPYQLTRYYDPIEFYDDSYVLQSRMYNPDLKPKFNTNIEGGFDLNMFRNRLTFNATYYENRTKNEVYAVPVLIETGYTRRLINSGLVRNRGVELSTDVVAVKTKGVQWTIGANWSMNRNKILEVPEIYADDPQGYTYATAGTVYFNAVKGGSLGDLYGYKLVRDPQGNVVYGSDGFTARNSYVEKVGNAFPKWRAGIQNSLRVGNFDFAVSFDGQYKGIVYSQTHHKMSEQGKLKHTLRFRDNPGGMMVGEGVVQNPDGSYSPNTKEVLVSRWYSDYYRRANVETNSFDASFIKLRDARIGYRFNKNVTQSMKLQEFSIALYGKNLAMWTKDFPIFDPETAAMDDADITPGVDIGALPSTRTFGISINVKF